MIRSVLPIPLALAMLGACVQDPAANAGVDIERAADQAQGTINAYGQSIATDRARQAAPRPAPVATPARPLRSPASGTPDGLPDERVPISEGRFTPDSAQGAADVVQTYYALLGERDYARARALWQPGTSGAGASPAAFAAQFARFVEYRGQVGAPGAIEAGAGQRFVTVPVQVSARLADGSHFDQRGDAVLHRTADVDGATAEQRRWRLSAVTLHPLPAATHPASVR